MHLGGYDSSYNFAEEYDLRLRLTRRFALERAAKPLYGIDKASVPFNDESVKTALRSFFTPESSANATVRVEMRLEPPPYEALPAIPAAFLTPRNVCFRDGPIMYVDYLGRALAVVDRKRWSCLIYSTDIHLCT